MTIDPVKFGEMCGHVEQLVKGQDAIFEQLNNRCRTCAPSRLLWVVAVSSVGTLFAILAKIVMAR
jgi:hypothetical protein